MRPRVLGTAPYFIVSDLQRSIDFYGKLGFGEPGIWGEPPCFAILHRDGFDILLSLAEDPSHVRPNGHGFWDMAVRISDLDGELAALEAAGIAIDKPPHDTEYEMRELEILDPDGYRICFSEDVS